MEEFVEQAVKVYQDCCSIPSLTAATLRVEGPVESDNDYQISIGSEWSQPDLIRYEKRKFEKSHLLTFSKAKGVFKDLKDTAFPTEMTNQQLSSESLSGRFKAIVRKISGKQKEDEKQIIEIWSACGLVKAIDVTSAKKHGKILDEGPFKFGCLQWSPSEKLLLYAAEKKVPEAISFFDKKSQGNETSEKEKPIKGDQFVYREDWGEQMVGVCHPVLVTLDVESEEIKVVDGIQDNLSVGQASWCKDEKSIVFAGWPHEPYRLGSIYCSNRRSSIYQKRLDESEPDPISPSQFCVYSPRLNPQKDKLVYIAVDSGAGPHMNCGRLMLYDFKTKLTTTVIDVVGVPGGDGFPGLYVTSLPRRCWSSDGNTVILDSFWRSAKHILMVSINHKTVRRLTEETGSWIVLDVQKDVVVASFANPTNTPRLMIATLPYDESSSPITWTTVAVSKEMDLKAELEWDIKSFVLPKESKDDLSKQYEAIFYTPKLHESSKKLPLVVWPHGGPHSIYIADFTLYPLALCRLGFAVLQVNFRGSIGFGQTSLLSLPGNVGTQDVQEVQFAASTVTSSGSVDPGNVFVCGGSHGGFLTAHLIGQFPEFYRASALKNPVINIASAVYVNDIPDWSFFECGFNYDYGSVPTSQHLLTLLDISPIKHASKIKAPTLLLVGSEDLRVPATEGKQLYNLLKARGIKTKLLLYPDNHPLSKVDVDSDAFVNMVRWFHEHRQTPAES